MRARNDALTDEIRRLREDPGAVEELAREELGLMMDGELLIILRDTPSVARTVSRRQLQRQPFPLTARRPRGTILELFRECLSLPCSV